MKRSELRVFLTGVLVGVILCGLVLMVGQARVAEAQLPPGPGEEVQLMRSMAQSLDGIEQTLRDRCR
jgi:hypothetical protein